MAKARVSRVSTLVGRHSIFLRSCRWYRKRALISGRRSRQFPTTQAPIDALVFSPPARQAGACPRRLSKRRSQQSLSANCSPQRTTGHSLELAPISDCSSAARRRPCRSDWHSVHRIARPRRTSIARCGTHRLAEISPPSFALSDYHSVFFKTCRPAATLNGSGSGATSLTTSFISSVTRSVAW